jgi:hypothetical protein
MKSIIIIIATLLASSCMAATATTVEAQEFNGAPQVLRAVKKRFPTAVSIRRADSAR